MSGQVNSLTIIGHVGANAELRYTPSGVPVANFNVAVSEKRKDASGEQQETTQWFKVVCWNKKAETAGQYVKKGMKIYVLGPVYGREWTGNTGEKRFSLEMTAHEMTFLTFVEGDGEEEQTTAKPAPRSRPAPKESSELDDIPF